jgi:hypothetical protein
MPADALISHVKEIGKPTSLGTISRRDENLATSFLQFLDNGAKEWNMRRIVEVNPYPFSIEIFQIFPFLSHQVHKKCAL